MDFLIRCCKCYNLCKSVDSCEDIKFPKINSSNDFYSTDKNGEIKNDELKNNNMNDKKK